MKVYQFIFMSVFVLGLSACGGGDSPRVTIGDATERRHFSANLTVQDFRSLADTLTNKMLEDDLFAEASEKPRIVVGSVRNFTDDENLRIDDLYDHTEEALVHSRMVRVMSRGSADFDLVGKFELSSSRQYGEKGEQEVTYMYKVKLYDIKGEVLGHWSKDLMLIKAKK